MLKCVDLLSNTSCYVSYALKFAMIELSLRRLVDSEARLDNIQVVLFPYVAESKYRLMC